MSHPGRGSTGPGRPAALPEGDYEPAGAVQELPGGRTVVAFHGDDGRRASFDVTGLPLPGWHPALAAAFAQRIGPGGGLRTRTAATTKWGSLGRLIRFLATLPDAPATPDRLTPAHLDAFHRHRAASAPSTAVGDMSELRLLFATPALRPLLSDAVIDHVQRRLPAPREHPDRPVQPVEADPASTKRAGRLTTGFSDAELARLLAALRSDVARIRDRIRGGEDLLRRYHTAPGALDYQERSLGKALAHMAATGEVAMPSGVPFHPFSAQRNELAGRLFVTMRDLPPLMMLAAALSERNGETIKELPAQHRMLQGRAVEVVIVKRRRGPRRWFETVTWEIGAAGRELHTPGGFYLLMLELTARSRAFSGSDLALCVWRNGSAARLSRTDDHYAPFAESLSCTAILPAVWAANRTPPLLADPAPAPGAPEPHHVGAARPLQVSFNRIRTSMEVRRTKRMGGHLPSAAKSNSMPVLFRHYLSGDPVITAWAQDVLGEALLDAEQTALAAHERAMQAAGGRLRVVPGPVDPAVLQDQANLGPQTAGQAAAGELDTGWTACVDHDHHPVTQAPCQISFIDCFHCGNCLVTREHLPRLLGLLDALALRRQQLPVQDWWARYGPAWAAIRRDILTKFTPAELRHAQQAKPTDILLDLIENPWEHR